MEDDTRYLINNLKLMIRDIVREELSERNEINLEDYRDEIEDMICKFIGNRVSVTLEV